MCRTEGSKCAQRYFRRESCCFVLLSFCSSLWIAYTEGRFDRADAVFSCLLVTENEAKRLATLLSRQAAKTTSFAFERHVYGFRVCMHSGGFHCGCIGITMAFVYAILTNNYQKRSYASLPACRVVEPGALYLHFFPCQNQCRVGSRRTIQLCSAVQWRCHCCFVGRGVWPGFRLGLFLSNNFRFRFRFRFFFFLHPLPLLSILLFFLRRTV